MSNSHGSTSGHFAHPTPSGSGGSFQSHQRKASDDGLPRRSSAGTSPRTEVLCQGVHSPSSPLPPPSSPSPPPLTSPSFTKCQQCAQQPKDKSAEAMGKGLVVDIPSGLTRTATSAGLPEGKIRAVSSSTPPTERPGEEMAGAKPKRFRSSSHITDVQTEARPQSLSPANGVHSADIMRTVTFPQPCVAEGGGSSKGKTVAEIHAHEDPASQRNYSQKRSTGSYRQSPLHSHGSHHDRGDSQTLVSSESRGSDSHQVASKRSKTTVGTTLMDHTMIKGSTDKDSNQSKSGKTPGEMSKTPASPSAASKDPPRPEGQGEIMGVSKRIQSALPSGDMWDSNLEPDELLEERLSATVIRRHVKVRSSTTTAAKKPQEPKSQAATPTKLPKDITDTMTPQETKSPTEENHETPQVKKESVLQKSANHPDCPADVIQSTTQTPPSATQASAGKPESVQRTVVSTSEKTGTTATAPPKQLVSKPERSSLSRSVETKRVVITADDNTLPLRKKDTLQKTLSAEQESLQSSRKESSFLKDRSLSVKSHGQSTKHVSIREPPETVVMVKDSDPRTQATASSSPGSKDTESPGPSYQKTAAESDKCSGSWVEDTKGAVTTTEANSLANPRNSKSCCFCWCCCCSCSWSMFKRRSNVVCKENDERRTKIRRNSVSVNNDVRGKRKGTSSPKDASGNLDHYFSGEGESQPTLEDIRMWGESFDKLMKCGAGRKVFREFLQCEYSEENILFWLACEDLKKETNSEIIEEKARLIYEEFISILSPREVSLDSQVRDIVNKNMVRPTSNTFDEAQLQIYTLMHRDSYPRFVNSAIYRKLAQLPAPSRKGSMA